MKKLLLSAACALLLPLSMSFAEPISVVTSFSILEDLTENIGQDKINVTSIIGADQDAHSFEPTPKDIITIQNADVVVLNGVEFDAWLSRLLKANKYEGIVIDTSRNVPLIALNDEHSHEEDSHNHDHDHDHQHSTDETHIDHKEEDSHDHTHAHGEYDPHIWQNPMNVIIMTENIKNGLTLALPEDAPYFDNNFKSYQEEMIALNNYATHIFKTVDTNGKLMVLHNSFAYLAKAYDLNFVAVSNINPLAEPSAKKMSELYTLVKDENIKAIFSENIAPSRFITTLASDLKLEDGGILYSDALTKTPPANDYIGLFKHNVDQITKALENSAKE